jgi:hypothetical protein
MMAMEIEVEVVTTAWVAAAPRVPQARPMAQRGKTVTTALAPLPPAASAAASR